MTFRMRTGRTPVVIVILGLTQSACGGDGGTDTTAAPTATTTSVENVVEVGMDDFAFVRLPDSVPARTRLTVANHAESELHELVVFRLADDEERKAADLAGLAPEELEATLGTPVAVLLAAPRGEQINVVGDGTLAEPGRYVVFCFIPTGVDPQVYLDAAAQSEDAPPQIEGAGPPHFATLVGRPFADAVSDTERFLRVSRPFQWSLNDVEGDGRSGDPWVGLPERSMPALEIVYVVGRGVLMIENLETFEEVVRRRVVDDWIVMFGSGYMSEPGVALIDRFGLPVAAWCDLDPHGIRIAADLERRLRREVTPIAMEPALLGSPLCSCCESDPDS